MRLLSYQEIHNWNLDYLNIYVKILQFLAKQHNLDRNSKLTTQKG